jgi:hypothetical protein
MTAGNRVVADAGSAGVGPAAPPLAGEPLEVIMAAKRPDFEREWS